MRVVDEAPRAVERIAALARENGWSVTFTAADGPPENIALRASRGVVRLWLLWRLDDGCRFVGGAHNVEGLGMHLATLTKARKVLASDPAAVERYLAGVA